MNRPNVFQFNDPIGFLKGYFAFLQLEEPEMTVRRWSAQMGFSSPKPLVSILRGSRILKLKDLDLILRGMDLSAAENRYLEALIMWSKERSPREKEVLQTLLNLLREGQLEGHASRTGQKVYEAEDQDLFSHWVDAAVISALRLKSTKNNLAKIRENLLWEPDGTQVDRSLDRVRNLGIVSETPEGITPRFDSVTTRSDRPHRGGRSYFFQVNRIAALAIELPYEQREFQCFSIPLKQSEIPAFKQLIRRMREEISSFSSEEGDTVYQFNLEMFPLLKPIEGRKDSSDAVRPLSTNTPHSP
jgi:uncharacterized protein (TIGR02147 family)